MLNLTIKNIKTSFKAYRNIYVLLMISQLMALLILLLIYGIITSANLRITEQKEGYKYLDATFDEPVPATEVKEILENMLNGLESEIEYCYIGMSSPSLGFELASIMDYDNGEFYMPQEHYPNERLVEGRYISQSEMTEGSNVALGYGDKYTTEDDGVDYSVGDKITIYGKEYELIGKIDCVTSLYRIDIPFETCTEDMKVSDIYIYFEDFPRAVDYEWFSRMLFEKFEFNVDIYDIKLVDLDDIISNNSIIAIAFIVGAIAAFNTILVYSYLLKKRKRQMAILSITGATKKQQVTICTMEVIIITLFTAVFGVGLFELLIKNVLVDAYEISIPVYTLKVYLLLLISYVGTIIIGTNIMININVSKKIMDAKRG